LKKFILGKKGLSYDRMRKKRNIRKPSRASNSENGSMGRGLSRKTMIFPKRGAACRWRPAPCLHRLSKRRDDVLKIKEKRKNIILEKRI